MKLSKCLGLGLVTAFLLVTPVYAYSPPPGGNVFLRIILGRPKIQIQLPPKIIMMPKQLSFPHAGVVYDFNPSQGQFVLTAGDRLFPNHRVTVTTANSGSLGEAYTIAITGFVLGELPTLKDFRITFVESVSKSDIEQLENYLATHIINTAKLTDADCSNTGNYNICLDTFTKVSVPGKTLESHLRQTIPLKGIRVGGNSAAPGASPGGTLANFIQTGKALAVGRSVVNVSGQTLTPYDVGSSSINWSNIGQKLTTQFNTQKSINRINADFYNAISWNLNSSDNGTPANPVKDSFSTPPEGKLWNVYVNPTSPQSNGSYHFGPGDNKTLTISGSGTITVRGTNGQAMPVVIHGSISCDPGTRFALVTEGNITFNTPPNGKMSVGCGSYTSLGGTITFGTGNVKEGNIKGIFVAKGNIVLPEPNALTSVFSIDPDTTITTNPTVLLRELLKIVFGSSS